MKVFRNVFCSTDENHNKFMTTGRALENMVGTADVCLYRIAAHTLPGTLGLFSAHCPDFEDDYLVTSRLACYN
jgi:hypothetical protein